MAALGDSTRATIWVGPPEALQDAWLWWVRHAGAGWTLTTAAPLAVHLTARLGEGGPSPTHRVVSWEDWAVEMLGGASGVLPSRHLAERLAAALRRSGDGPWRNRPGATVALAETVLRLRREGVPRERLARLWTSRAAWIRAGYDAVAALLGETVEASRAWLVGGGETLAARVRDRALAWYGVFPGAVAGRAWAAGAPGGPRAVFVPSAGGPADAWIRSWVQAWVRRGARLIRLDGARAAPVDGVTVPARGLLPAAVAGLGTAAADAGTVVVTSDAETADVLAEALGHRPAGGDRRSRWLLAWAAADAQAPFESVLAWLGAAGAAGPAERLEVARHGPYRDRWPAAVRDRWVALVEARRAVRLAPGWRAAGEAVERLAARAGVPSPLTEPDRLELAAWDAVETLAPTPEDLEAWAQALGDPPSPPSAAVAPWSGLAGAFFEQLVVVGAEGGFQGDGPSSPLLDARAERALGLPSAADRDRWLAALLPLSARRVTVVRVAGRPWPSTLRPHRERVQELPWSPGAGLGPPPAAVRVDLFPPGAVPLPVTVTGFERYGRCPLAYAWERLGFQPLPDVADEPAPDLVGRWLHEALEQLGREPPPPSDAYGRARAAVLRAMERYPAPPALLPDVLAGVVDGLVADLVRHLLEAPDGEPVATEWPFQVEWGAGPLSGRVDRIERRGTAWWVVDFKSGRLPPARVGPASLQLAVYAGAVAAGFGVPLAAVRAEFVGIRERANQHQRRTLAGDAAERWSEAVAVLRGIAERIVRGRLPPFPEPGACRACPYRVACPTGVDSARVRTADADPAFAALWESTGKGEDDGDATA
ncbi:MAG: PD-(D/E)XK nuclease family protein [Actinomycetia bacterium]|nr:PD-(D/E)XK nuclease family protein [Actinomycetes bacterium]